MGVRNEIRVTDLWVGVCACHPPSPPIPMAGVVILASFNVSANSMGAARFGDITIGFCGHPGILVTASSVSTANNRGMVREGDIVAGCNIGATVAGSGNSWTA